MNFFQEIRLAFIDDRLVYTGKANRSDLTKAFRISFAQAAADFSVFSKRFPGRMVYSGVHKCYRPYSKTPVFSDIQRLAVREMASAFQNEQRSNKQTAPKPAANREKASGKKPNENWYRLSGLNGGPLVPQSDENP